MSHGHAHGADRRGGTPLAIALAVTLAIAAFEFGGGIVSRSLALVADSAHVAMDALALGISVFAALAARRPANARRTFGYARFEMLAALANGGLLLGVAAFIAFEAIGRLRAPSLPDGGPMAIVAGIGLVVNVALGIALARGSRADLNVRAALYHVASDALGAVAVVLGGLAILTWRVAWIDPVLSILVAALVVVGVLRIFKEAGDVLLESAPEHASIPAVRARMRERAGVVGVHDLHVWTIGSGSHVLTAHVVLADKRISEATAILRDLETDLHDAFDIHHVTIQFECESCEESDRIVCVNEPASPANSR